MCALCARMAQSNGRERTTMKSRAQKRKKKRTPRTPPKSYKKCHLGAKMAPKIDPGTLCFGLGAQFLARSTPRRVQERSWEPPGGEKKTWDAPKGAPSEFPNHFLPFSKPNPPPRGGGAACSAPAFWHPFLENRCFRVGGVQKSRVQGLRGHSPGLGGEAKASPTTSFACCLELRFAKLAAPLRGAGADLTMARPVGRRTINAASLFASDGTQATSAILRSSA